MKIVKQSNGKSLMLKTQEIKLEDLPNLNNALVMSILKSLEIKEMYPKQIAKKLKIHEQNVYYYIRQLEKAKLISVARQENINGTVAKFYRLNSDSFFVKVGEFRESSWT